MKIHEEILNVARRLCIARRGWTFTPAEIVHALPHLNERSVRTHIVSRCCVNAPKHHAHRWPYFRRVSRGVYEILKEFREIKPGIGKNLEVPVPQVAETQAAYEPLPAIARPVIHAVVVESEGQYVADCLEVAIATQGASLDELLVNLREAVELYMSDEDPVVLGLTPEPRLLISYETSVRPLPCLV